MTAEKKSAGIINESELVKGLIHDIRMARHLIENPGYFYQQPAPEQEEKFKEDYLFYWENVSITENIKIPKTIETFFGKVEFIKDITHFKDIFLKKYDLVKNKSGEIPFLEENSHLSIDRKRKCEELDSLSSEEVKALQNETKDISLQVFDFPTGKLFPFTL